MLVGFGSFKRDTAAPEFDTALSLNLNQPKTAHQSGMLQFGPYASALGAHHSCAARPQLLQTARLLHQLRQSQNCRLKVVQAVQLHAHCAPGQPSAAERLPCSWSQCPMPQPGALLFSCNSDPRASWQLTAAYLEAAYLLTYYTSLFNMWEQATLSHRWRSGVHSSLRCG